MRPLSPRVQEFLELALKYNLSHPLGRALYATNRLWNGWPWVYPDPTKTTWCRPFRVDAVDLMRRTRVSTALRWEHHWKNGGGLQCINKTHKEQLAVRRIRDRKRRELYRAQGIE